MKPIATVAAALGAGRSGMAGGVEIRGTAWLEWIVARRRRRERVKMACARRQKREQRA